GGVGKTTTTANLAAFFAAHGKKVLVIDLDYQGSLSAMVLSDHAYAQYIDQLLDEEPCKASELITGQKPSWVRHTAHPLEDRGFPKSRLIPATYWLAGTENAVQLRWLLQPKKTDIRYSLARALHDNDVRQTFDIVLIDAPPRLTTACIQALCASSHVVIPTILDKTSAAAVATFCNQLVILQKLWPRLKVAGVLPTMVEFNPVARTGELRETPLKQHEFDARQLAEDTMALALKRAQSPLDDASIFPLECSVPDKSFIGRQAGNRTAYTLKSAQSNEVREIFDRVGHELANRVALALDD
ncbi:MAG: ParA family protein, partial [Pseudomonadota bacterium]